MTKSLTQAVLEMYFQFGDKTHVSDESDSNPVHQAFSKGFHAIYDNIRKIPGNTVYFTTYGEEIPGPAEGALDEVRMDLYDHEGEFNIENGVCTYRIAFHSSKEIIPDLAHEVANFAITKFTEAAEDLPVRFMGANITRTFVVTEKEPYSFLQ